MSCLVHHIIRAPPTSYPFAPYFPLATLRTLREILVWGEVKVPQARFAIVVGELIIFDPTRVAAVLDARLVRVAVVGTKRKTVFKTRGRVRRVEGTDIRSRT